MLNLKKPEKLAILFLAAALLLGTSLSLCKKLKTHPDVRIGHFDIDKEYSHRRVNINIASADELAGLKGVGNVLAGRIAEYRLQKGRFSAIEDIKNVKGIGPSLFDKLKDDIAVE